MSKRQALSYDPIEVAREAWRSRGWEAAAPGMALMTSVVRVQQVFLGRIEAELRPIGLSMARYEVLMMLVFSKSGELPLGKLGSRLQVQPGAITNAVDRLEADRCVRRVQHPTDGRTTLAKVTAKGEKLALQATLILNDRVYEKIELPRDKVDELFDLLKIVRARAGDFPIDSVTPNGHVD